MNIRMVGIDHNKASIEYREFFSFTKLAAATAMQRVTRELGAEGCVILSTCNRTELWLSGETPLTAFQTLCAVKDADPETYSAFAVEREGEAAVWHLLTTSCGMNSKVFGEDQIVTQVGDALALAHDCGCAGKVLEKLFLTAVTAAKKVKSSVRLTALNSSVALRMEQKLLEELGSLEGVPCLVIGNGEMGRLAARTLVSRGAKVRMTLRSYKRGVVQIPAGCGVVPYEDRLPVLGEVRVVISATTSPHHTVKYEEALPYLKGDRKVFVDLAVPRDISSRLKDHPGVSLYDIDSLGGAAMDESANAGVAQANAILEEYREEFANWYYFRGLIPAIQEIGDLAAADVTSRIERTVSHLPEGQRDEVRAQVRNASAKVVCRMLYGLREQMDRGLWEDCIKSLERAVEG